MTTRLRAVQVAAELIREIAAAQPLTAAAAAVMLVVLTFTEGASVLLLAPLLETVGVMEESPLPRATDWITRTLAVAGLEVSLGTLLALLILVTALRTAARRWVAGFVAAVREDMMASRRDRLYRAIAAAEWQYLVSKAPAEFANALTGEMIRVGTAVTFLTDLAVLVAAAVVYMALAIRLSPPMAALVIGSAGLLAWTVRGSLDRARAVGARGADARQSLHGMLTEHVNSLKTSRSYDALDRHAAEFARLSREAGAIGVAAARNETDLLQQLELGSTVVLAAIVYVAGTFLAVAPAVLLVLLFVFARVMPRLINIYRLLQGLMTVLPAVDRIAILERECLRAAAPVAATPTEVTFANEVRFENVTFSYRGQHTPAVAGVSLAIKAGETTAIMGASGSGKSTMADLLAGLLTPAEGRILIDGRRLSPGTLASWRRQIGYVPQDTFLFNDTIRANLAWARPGATDDEIWSALELAAADGFVSALGNGLATVIGDRGVLLSGGERQRLAIARAVLRRPRLLVLDEATSALDTDHEQRIQQAIDGLRHRMTVVVITHRASAVRRADRVYILESGRVLESRSTIRAAR